MISNSVKLNPQHSHIIHERRIEKNWSQAALAAEANVSERTISRIENIREGEERSFDIIGVRMIAQALELNLDEIGLGEDDTREERRVIIHSIEFSPEFYQAGMSILSYFGTIVRRKYSDKSIGVRIEQEGLRITLVIETPSGIKERIEECLDNYGLVIRGKMAIEEFVDNQFEVLELRNQLRIANLHLEWQRDLLKLKDASIERLSMFLYQALRLRNPPSCQYITVSPDINTRAIAEAKPVIEISPRISMMQGGLNELREALPDGSSEIGEVQDALQDLEKIKQKPSPEEIQQSVEMSRLGRFLKKMDDPDSNLGRTIKAIKHGIDIAQDLAGGYNEIAQWCGLPQVPKPFLKKFSTS